MTTHPETHLRTALAVIGSLALAATLLAAGPTSAASPTACRVKNLDSGITKASLHKAVARARAGDRLTVRGTCRGITTIGKDLTIRGIRRPGSGRPTLDGARLGRVVTVNYGVKVTMRDLTLLHGKNPGDGLWGAGFYNWGTLVLRDVTVRDNHTKQGGGGGENAGTLMLNGSSSIRGNTAGTGGGLVNIGSATLVMNDSSSIRGNTATWEGGGVLNEGTLVMHDSSSIQGNTATNWGGGGVLNKGTLDGVVCDGTDANVHDNTPDNCTTHEGPFGR